MSFDRLAPHYRWMEVVLAGSLLQKCRVRWMEEVRESRRALLVGEGNGRMLQACASTLPHCEFTVLDQSRAMLDQARCRWARTGGTQSIHFEHADLLDWNLDGRQFDLVVTNYFLDCFNEDLLPRVVEKLGGACVDSARWLLADFAMPAKGWARWRAFWVLRLAYGFFRLTTDISARTLVSPDSAVIAAGFRLQRREWFNHGLLHADLWIRGD